MRAITILSIGSAVMISGCGPGDFCDVVQQEIAFDPRVAAQIVEHDRPVAERLDAQNGYFRRWCP